MLTRLAAVEALETMSSTLDIILFVILEDMIESNICLWCGISSVEDGDSIPLGIVSRGVVRAGSESARSGSCTESSVLCCELCRAVIQ